MKNITIEELRKRIKLGDLYYSKHKRDIEHDGWRLYLGNGRNVGLNTKIKGSNSLSFAHDFETITQVIFIEDGCLNYLSNFGEFLQTFNEDLVKNHITYVKEINPKEQQLQNLINNLQNQLNDAKDKLDKITTVGI